MNAAQSRASEEAALLLYHEDPFNANAIADLRPVAYQKAIFMAYFDNLLAWGDDLFSLATRETIHEAAQLYRLALDILGPEPTLDPYVPPAPMTYAELEVARETAGVNEFLVEIAPAPPIATQSYSPNLSMMAQGLYFGVIDNPRLSGCWQLVDDRLYKIRHGLSLSGEPADLPLFEAGMDPAALVGTGGGGQSAIAAPNGGVSLTQATSEAIEVAKTLIQGVMELGRSLQSALEARDAEALAVLRDRHEGASAEQLRRIRQAEVNEARESFNALSRALEAARYRKQFQDQRIRKGLIPLESRALLLAELGLAGRRAAASANLVSVGLYLLPNIFGVAAGGFDPGESVASAAQTADSLATALSEQSMVLTTRAEHARRAEDWSLEAKVSGFDVQQLSAELRAARHRIRAAELQFALEASNKKHAAEVDAYYQSKFSSTELYQWMADTLAELYYQLYQIADTATRTVQTAINAETGQNANNLSAGGWDPQHRGLLAGERLLVDLARMEQEYLRWKRSQASRHISSRHKLSDVDPLALRSLQREGSARFELREERFARLHPGLYLRRTEALSLRFVGPAGLELHGELAQSTGTLLRSPDPASARFLLGADRSPGAGLGRALRESRARFSGAMGEPIPLPALGGAPSVGHYRLSLPKSAHRFEPSAIDDVEIELVYTALEGGDSFRAAVEQALPPLRVARGFALETVDPAGLAALREGAGVCRLPIAANAFPRNLAGLSYTARALRLEVQVDAPGALRLGLPAGLPVQEVSVPTGGLLVLEAALSMPLSELLHPEAQLRLEAGAELCSSIRSVFLSVEVEEG